LITQEGQKQTDRELVANIIGGDQHAFKLLIKSTEKLVTHLVFKMIPVAADRNDVAQDVYMKAYSHLAAFRFQSKLSTWIGQLTYNTCLHYLQKKRPMLLERFFHDDESDMPEMLSALSASVENETESKLFARELTATIDGAVQQLSPLYQTLVGLYYKEELPLSEIAEITGLPEGTVKNYLFRARKRLKEILIKIQKKEGL